MMCLYWPNDWDFSCPQSPHNMTGTCQVEWHLNYWYILEVILLFLSSIILWEYNKSSAKANRKYIQHYCHTHHMSISNQWQWDRLFKSCTGDDEEKHLSSTLATIFEWNPLAFGIPSQRESNVKIISISPCHSTSMPIYTPFITSCCP